MLAFYRATLAIALRHPLVVMLVLLSMIGLNVYLFRQMTYSLFPVQDTGLLIGSIQGDQSISFQSMKQKLAQLQTIVQDDPAVATVVGVTGGRQANSGFVYISLKPFAERTDQRRRRGRAAARQARRSGRRAAVPRRGVGLAHRRAAEQRDLSVHPSLGRHGDALQMGAATDRGVATERHLEGRQFRSAARRPRSRSDDRSRDREAAGAHLERRSTTPSTTLSASGRFRLSTMRSTNITSSWRWRRAIGRTPRP